MLLGLRGGRQKQKARCAVGVSGLGFPIKALKPSSVVLRQHARRMVVVMVMGREDHNESILG
jgi:hypothetical protein